MPCVLSCRRQGVHDLMRRCDKILQKYESKLHFIEENGTYDLSTEPSTFKINEELAEKWLANGAQPTEAVGKLLKACGCLRYG